MDSYNELNRFEEILSEIEYRLGLKYCILNDSISAFYWLKCAALKNHTKAISIIYEMSDKKLI